MSYNKALEAAGATVHDWEQFGSYQGDWLADVTVNGKHGFIRDCFGSCSYCDAFESEFGYEDDACDQHRYDHNPECLGCREKKAKYDEKLKAFGQRYLDDLLTKDEVLKLVSENLEWDANAQEMVDWINAKEQSREVSVNP